MWQPHSRSMSPGGSLGVWGRGERGSWLRPRALLSHAALVYRVQMPVNTQRTILLPLKKQARRGQVFCSRPYRLDRWLKTPMWCLQVLPGPVSGLPEPTAP